MAWREKGRKYDELLDYMNRIVEENTSLNQQRLDYYMKYEAAKAEIDRLSRENADMKSALERLI